MFVTTYRYRTVWLLLFGWPLWAGSVRGQEQVAKEQEQSPPAAAAPADTAASEATAEAEAAEPAVAPTAESPVQVAPLKVKRDPAFERYVDRKLLGQAVEKLNAQLLTDVALQFVVGERSLFRSHKSVTAGEVLELAVQVAADKRDAESLDRLAQGAAQIGNEELAARIQAAQQLAASARAVDPALTVSVETMTPRTFELYQRSLRYIDRQKLLHNSEALEGFRERLPELKHLGDAERKFLEQHIASALESLPEEGSLVVDKLALLSFTSRATPQQVVALDSRLYGTWTNGRQSHTFTAKPDKTAAYSYKPFGQKGATLVLEPTERDRVYRVKSGATSVFLFFTFTDDKLQVQRHNGTKYVAYGTWTKRAASSKGTMSASTGRTGK